jgi:hypothetical protein
VEDSLDLHTFKPAEASDLVAEYLRAARAAGLTTVRIIHGKGTGRLRDTVHAVLRAHPEVAAFAPAPEYLGGWGATVVTLGVPAAPTPRPAAPPPAVSARRDAAVRAYLRFSPLISLGGGVLMLARMRTDYEVVRWLLIAVLAGFAGWFAERRARRLGAVTGFAARLVFTNICWFLLPFYLRSASFAAPGHVLSVGLLALLTLTWELNKVTRRIEDLPTGRGAMRALTLFYLLNMALPTVAQASLDQAWWVAAAAAGLLYLAAGFARLARPWPWRLAAAPTLGLLAVLWRPWFPPVPMWLAGTRWEPGAATLPGEPGALTLHTDIVAPQGLRERLEHVWRWHGRVTDRVPLDIAGGRKEGFRTRSRKRNWPAEPAGTWQVEVRTTGGRLLGAARYELR